MQLLDRRPYAYRTSFPLDEARLPLADGSEAPVLVKDLGRSRLEERVRLAKPDFVHDPRREIVVYEEILEGHALGAPRFYGSIVTPEEDSFVLVIEKVEGTELWQHGDLTAWQETARWAARLHSTIGPAPSAPLLRYDAPYYRRWLDRARGFRPESRLESLADAHERAVERLSRLPRVFVHGELYPSNVLVARGRIATVDWEMAGIGPGVLDLAALVTAWEGTESEQIVAAYEEAVGAPVEEGDLHAARLLLAVQWLGWSQAWTPPSEHAKDWLAEATGAAERLGA